MKKFLGTLVFWALLLALLVPLGSLMEYKASREKLAPFLERAEQVDVLFLGDSHASSGIYPMELWHDYGIASYNLASYNVPLPVSYWVMRNALLRCKPKVVVLDVNQIWEQTKPCESSSDLHTALDGFPMTSTKWEAILDLTDDPLLTDKSEQRYADLRPEFVFPFIKYHARWNDISADDFRPDYNLELGGERNIAVAEPDEYTISYAAASEEGFGFQYLRRVVEHCKSEGIEVLLVNLPYPCKNNNDEQLYTNAVAYTAEDCGVEYVDFVFLDQIVDYSTDCYDPGSHLNPSGAIKVTDFIGRLLAREYGLKDHRGEAAYASWNADYAVYRARKLESLRKETDPRNFLMLLSDPSWSVVVSLPEDSAVYADGHAMQLMQNIGREHLYMEDTEDAVWSDGLMPLEALEDAAQTGEAYLAAIDRTGGQILECVGEGALEISFGEATLDSASGAALRAENGEQLLSERADADFHIAIVDPETGALLLARSMSL